MKKTKRKWDMLTDEQRQTCIREVIVFFNEKRDEQLGVIAAEEILDFFLQTTSGHIYNKAVQDSKNLLKERFEDLQIDLESLLG